jgi:hypothetical protein
MSAFSDGGFLVIIANREEISRTCSEFRPFHFGLSGGRALDWLEQRSSSKQA